MTIAQERLFTLKLNKEEKIRIIKIYHNISNLAEEIIMDEDILLQAYQDTVGIWTIGVGHTKGVIKGDKITLTKAIELLGSDLNIARKDCLKLFPDFENFTLLRQHALISMSYNLGYPRLSQFKNTIKLINQGKWSQASIEMLRSRWHKQVWNRSLDIAEKLVKECKE